MTESNKKQAALIIRKLKQDSGYLENNFFFQNATDTFKILNRINAIDRRLITGKLLAQVTKLLISLEIEPGGPYADGQEKPDPELNREIAIFLKNQGIILPNLERFSPKTTTQTEDDKVFEHIHCLTKRHLKNLCPPFKAVIQTEIKKIIDGDRDKQILLLAYYFKLSLGNLGAKIPPETIYGLGSANLFLWLSYSLYDDLIDGDESFNKLPIANWAAREFILHFSRQDSSREFHSFFRKIMARMDYSQIWESKYAKIKNHITVSTKDYQKPSALYNKSLAHCLGPMLILDRLKYPPNSPTGKDILSFFKHYLSARQLQDDIYDFKTDYQKGIITAANIKLIKNNISEDQIDNHFIKKELPQLQCKIKQYQETARSSLRNAKIIRYPNYLSRFLSPPMVESEKIKDFLETYKR